MIKLLILSKKNWLQLLKWKDLLLFSVLYYCNIFGVNVVQSMKDIKDITVDCC